MQSKRQQNDTCDTHLTNQNPWRTTENKLYLVKINRNNKLNKFNTWTAPIGQTFAPQRLIRVPAGDFEAVPAFLRLAGRHVTRWVAAAGHRDLPAHVQVVHVAVLPVAAFSHGVVGLLRTWGKSHTIQIPLTNPDAKTFVSVNVTTASNQMRRWWW